jgi:hypothetical protein
MAKSIEVAGCWLLVEEQKRIPSLRCGMTDKNYEMRGFFPFVSLRARMTSKARKYRGPSLRSG